MTTVTAVRERPILFSPEMVRAILDGRKTQTRRVMMPQPPRIAGLYARDGRWYMPPGEPAAVMFPRCPYGHPGDRLWVREAWQLWEIRRPVIRDREVPTLSEWTGPIDPAGPPAVDHQITYRATDDPDMGRWRPSIHMPRWASRITLEITDVRVERVQDITDADCYAEGLPEDEPSAFEDAEMAQAAGLHIPEGSAERHWFRVGWDRLNARRGYGWDANPWVWVLTFRRVR